MPRGGFDDEYDNFGGPSRTSTRKPRNDDDKYGSSRHRQGPDDDSRERGKGMEVARRSKAKKYSDSEDEEPKKKSKKKSKSKSKSKKRQESSDEDDDDNEVIVTKTKRYKDVDIDDLAGEYLDALIDVFEVRPQKIERWCHDGLIRLDTQTGMFDADKLIDQKASEDEQKEWARYEKKYKRMMKENKEMWEGRGGHGGPSGPTIIYTGGSGPRRSRGGCYDCALIGGYCGHSSY